MRYDFVKIRSPLALHLMSSNVHAAFLSSQEGRRTRRQQQRKIYSSRKIYKPRNKRLELLYLLLLLLYFTPAQKMFHFHVSEFMTSNGRAGGGSNPCFYLRLNSTTVRVSFRTPKYIRPGPVSPRLDRLTLFP